MKPLKKTLRFHGSLYKNHKLYPLNALAVKFKLMDYLGFIKILCNKVDTFCRYNNTYTFDNQTIQSRYKVENPSNKFHQKDVLVFTVIKEIPQE